MKLLVISTVGGDGELDAVLKAQEHGHKVKWFVPATEKSKYYGKGMVDRVDDWHPWMRWADLIVLADNTKYLVELDRWRKDGGKVIGATQESATWELNRTLGMDVFRKKGISVPPYKEFSEYDAAISYVKREMQRFVSKPCGDEPDKSLSYVSKSPADLVYMLDRWKKAQKLKGKFILQEFKPGTEMAVGCWIGPEGFASGWCENWEFKKLMAGDVGPNCGEMGTVLRYVEASKLARKVLKPLEAEIVATGHTGYVDVNCIIDENGQPWPLEWTTRMGWPTFNIQLALSKGDPIEWLAGLADGQDFKPWQMDMVATGVVMALPDFPYSHATRKEVVGVPIYGVTKRNEENLHYCNVMMGDSPVETNGKILTMPTLQTAGDYVLVATGTGETIRLARDKAYRAVRSLTIPCSPFWRPDIGSRLKTQLPKIQEQGFATGLLY